MVESLARRYQVRVVTLPFEAINSPADADVPAPCRELDELVRTSRLDVSTDAERRYLLATARGVGTRLSISPEERDALRRAGYVVALRKCREIVAALAR